VIVTTDVGPVRQGISVTIFNLRHVYFFAEMQGIGMPGERLSMRKIRELLRHAARLSQRAIGKSVGLSKGAVCHYLSRARHAGLDWPLPDGLDDEVQEALLFLPPPDRTPKPELAWVHRELRRRDAT